MRKYDDEYKQAAVKKIHDGQSVASVARELGVAESLLHNWKRQVSERSSDADKETLLLKRRIRELEMERDMSRRRQPTILRQKRVVRYRFIDEAKDTYPIGLVCRVMRVSPSAYHAYASGKTYVLSRAKAAIASQVEAVFYQHRRRRYGSRRIQAELLAQGIGGGRFQVRSLMRRLTLHAIAAKRFRPPTADSRHTSQVRCEPVALCANDSAMHGSNPCRKRNAKSNRSANSTGGGGAKS